MIGLGYPNLFDLLVHWWVGRHSCRRCGHGRHGHGRCDRGPRVHQTPEGMSDLGHPDHPGGLGGMSRCGWLWSACGLMEIDHSRYGGVVVGGVIVGPGFIELQKE